MTIIVNCIRIYIPHQLDKNRNRLPQTRLRIALIYIPHQLDKNALYDEIIKKDFTIFTFLIS